MSGCRTAVRCEPRGIVTRSYRSSLTVSGHNGDRAATSRRADPHSYLPPRTGRYCYFGTIEEHREQPVTQVGQLPTPCPNAADMLDQLLAVTLTARHTDTDLDVLAATIDREARTWP